MNKHTLPDGRVFRVLNDNILVERVKLPETYSGGRIIVNREKEDATAIGIVRAVGMHAVKKPAPGGPTHVPIDDLVPGMYCAFLWFYAERHTNQQISRMLGDGLIILKWEDIGLYWPADEKHEISDIRSNGA